MTYSGGTIARIRIAGLAFRKEKKDVENKGCGVVLQDEGHFHSSDCLLKNICCPLGFIMFKTP